MSREMVEVVKCDLCKDIICRPVLNIDDDSNNIFYNVEISGKIKFPDGSIKNGDVCFKCFKGLL